MVLSIILVSLTVIGLVLSVLLKPYIKIKKVEIGLFWIIALIGALLVLIFGTVPFDYAINGITAKTSVNPLKISVLFLSMTLISVFLESSGFFDYVAKEVFVRIDHAGLKLFVALYVVVSILTIFTSNDIIILTFTPPICIFAKKARISPIPYLFAEFIAANTWSVMLIVGNPTNIYLASSYGITFSEYFSLMWLPAIVCGVVSFFMLLLLFYHTLKAHSEKLPTIESELHSVNIEKVPLIVCFFSLLLCIVLLAFADLIRLEMYLICLIFAIFLTLFHVVYYLIKEKSIKKVLKSISHVPFELVPFILSMFILVLSLSYNGVNALLNDMLITTGKRDAVLFGALSGLFSNLLNNIPMSVLFESVIAGTSKTAVLATIIGSNVGAFITPVGALAGIMWNKILKKYNVALSFKRFCFYGVVVAIPTLFFASLSLLLL